MSGSQQTPEGWNVRPRCARRTRPTCQSEELIGPTLFLVSELASYVTGVVLPLDGG